MEFERCLALAPSPSRLHVPSVESRKDAFDSWLPALVGAKRGAYAFLMCLAPAPSPSRLHVPSVESGKDAFDSGMQAATGTKQCACSVLI